MAAKANPIKEVDYIVVGLGIAGICFCENLIRNKKSFIAFDIGLSGATATSGGILNPTVLRWFNVAWKASEFYPYAIPFYETLAERLQKKFFTLKSIYKIFKDADELNNWVVATDKQRTKSFLATDLVKNVNSNIQAPLGFGEVKGAVQIDVPALLSGFANFLNEEGKLVKEQFQYDVLKVSDNQVKYKDICAKHMVFCEGIQALDNPFFPSEKLVGNKGEFLIIKAPKLRLDVFLKGPMYIIPLGYDIYKVGATFISGDLSLERTAYSEKEIRRHLKTMISCDFEVLGMATGIRPTTPDRAPLIGKNQEHPEIAFLNGLGSRGFMMAPLLSETLYNHLEKDTPIPGDIDINRAL